MNKFREIALAVGVIMLAIVIYFKPIFFDNKNLSQHDLTQAAGANQEVKE